MTRSLTSLGFKINFVCSVGYVPGTTAVRKVHQIPVDSLTRYLQNEVGLHQEGDHYYNFQKLYTCPSIPAHSNNLLTL